MPGDLRDPEQAYPFHHDNLYRRAPNPFEAGATDMDKYLQSISFEETRQKLSPEKLEDIKEELTEKGCFMMNPGSEEFRDDVRHILKRYKMARKVVRKWLI